MTRPGRVPAGSLGDGAPFGRLEVREHVVVEFVERDDFPLVSLETSIVFEFLGAEVAADHAIMRRYFNDAGGMCFILIMRELRENLVAGTRNASAMDAISFFCVKCVFYAFMSRRQASGLGFVSSAAPALPAPCARHIRYSRRHSDVRHPASVPARGWRAPPGSGGRGRRRAWCLRNSGAP